MTIGARRTVGGSARCARSRAAVRSRQEATDTRRHPMAATQAALERPEPAVEEFETIVIGGGQAGLSLGYYLKQLGQRFTILDANERVGGSWRTRTWDSLRLFTPTRYNGLPGWGSPHPAGRSRLPGRPPTISRPTRSGSSSRCGADGRSTVSLPPTRGTSSSAARDVSWPTRS